MSRLDYVTIAIVAICIFAIVFLVVKTSRLMNREESGTESNRIEDALTNQGSSVEDIYSDLEVDTTYQSYDDSRPGAAGIDDQEDNGVDPFDPVEDEAFGDERTVTPPPAPKKERATTSTATPQRDELTSRGGSTTPSTSPKSSAPARSSSKPAASGTTNTTAGTAAGSPFAVIAGSFRYKANAEEMVRKLKRLGYENAEVGSTNAGAYAVAVVDRLKELESARLLVSELESKHKIDARVQKQ